MKLKLEKIKQKCNNKYAQNISSLKGKREKKIYYTVVTNIKRNDFRLLHSGISISKRERAKSTLMWLPLYIIIFR